MLADAAAYHARTLEEIQERYTPPVRLPLEMGRYVLAEDYVRALKGRDLLTREVETALAAHDALVLPALPIPAPPLGAETAPVGATSEPVRNLMLRLTQLFDPPAIPLFPFRAARLRPACGLRLAGARDETEALLAVALACERQIAGG